MISGVLKTPLQENEPLESPEKMQPTPLEPAELAGGEERPDDQNEMSPEELQGQYPEE